MTLRSTRREAASSTEEAYDPAQLVRIDQEPLRSAAGAECQAAMAELEKARTLWHRFERKDKPSFIRWRAREFGALLSKAREVEGQIRENEALVYEVELEMRRTIIDPHSAYQRVMYRRANPSAPEEPRAEGGAGQGRRVTEFEQEALFQDWVKKFHRDQSRQDGRRRLHRVVQRFQVAHVREQTGRAARPNKKRRARPAPVFEMEEEAETPVDARVKELYRLLVRRLHPDLRADGSAAVSSLWHEVQEAYAMGDVGRLEILLALSDIAGDAVSDQTTLAQMRAVHEELRRALDALERSLIVAQRDDAWDFARLGANQELRSQVQDDLERNLVTRTTRLTALQKIIAEWAHPPGENRQVGKVRRYAV